MLLCTHLFTATALDPLRPEIKFLIDAISIAANQSPYKEKTVETMVNKHMTWLHEHHQFIEENLFSDLYRHPGYLPPVAIDDRFHKASDIWANGTREECLNLLVSPFKHNIMGFAYFGTENN